MRPYVAQGIETLAEVGEALVGSKRGYILHHNGAGTKGMNYPLEFGDQVVTRVRYVEGTVQCTESRETLTGGAAGD